MTLSRLRPCLVFAGLAVASVAHADPYVTVCDSGCDYTTVQGAVDSISDSDADNVYTITIEQSVLESDTSTTFSGKSYINLAGRGMQSTHFRASATWFTDAKAGSIAGDFLDLSGSSHINLSNLTVDALTQDPGEGQSAYFLSAVRVDDADQIVIDGCAIDGFDFGVWEDTNSTDHTINIFGSKVRGANYGAWAKGADWYVFGSELLGNNDGQYVTSAIGASVAFAVDSPAGASVTVWGSSLTGKSANPDSVQVRGLQAVLAAGAELSIVGSTLYADFEVENDSAQVACLNLSLSSGRVRVVGSEFVYENDGTAPAGHVAGLAFSGSPNAVVSLSGVTFTDGGGTGPTGARADIVKTAGTASVMTLETAGTIVRSVKAISGGITGLAHAANTLTDQRGTVTFATAATAAVTLPVALPDTTYTVALSVDRNENVWVTSKTTTGFTVNSSNGASVAVVDWILSR